MPFAELWESWTNPQVKVYRGAQQTIRDNIAKTARESTDVTDFFNKVVKQFGPQLKSLLLDELMSSVAKKTRARQTVVGFDQQYRIDDEGDVKYGKSKPVTIPRVIPLSKAQHQVIINTVSKAFESIIIDDDVVKAMSLGMSIENIKERERVVREKYIGPLMVILQKALTPFILAVYKSQIDEILIALSKAEKSPNMYVIPYNFFHAQELSADLEYTEFLDKHYTDEIRRMLEYPNQQYISKDIISLITSSKSLTEAQYVAVLDPLTRLSEQLGAWISTELMAINNQQAVSYHRFKYVYLMVKE